MIKHETFEVSGVVLYCDVCKKRGPEEAYDNTNALIDDATREGWDADGDHDTCPGCRPKQKKPKKRKR